MAVYSSIGVQGTEFISLTGDPLPSCLNDTEPHVVGSGLVMRPAVVKKDGEVLKNILKTCIYIPSPLFSFKMVCLLCVVGLSKISMQVAIHFIQENEKYQVRDHLSSSLGHGPRGEVITPVYYRESMSNRL